MKSVTDKILASMHRMALLALLAAVPGIALCEGEKRQPLNPPVTVKIATFRSSGDSAFVLAQTRGYFREEGLEVEFVPFGNTGDSAQALALGSVDVGTGPVNAGLINALARGIPLKIVGSAGAQPRGHGIVALVLREDLVSSGRYKSPADLRGLKLSVPGRTSPGHYMLKELAERAGHQLKELNVVHLGLAEGLPAMVNKSLDGVITIEPFVSKTVKEAPGVRVIGMDEVTPGFQLAYLLYSSNFSTRNPEAAKRFMIAYLRASRDYAAAFGSQRRETERVLRELQAGGIAASASTVPISLDPDSAIGFTGIDRFATWLLEEGAIKQKVDLRAFVDDQFRTQAIKALAKP